MFDCPVRYGYKAFVKEKRRQIQKNNPDFSYSDVSIKLAKMWRDLPKHQKQYYNNIGFFTNTNRKSEVRELEFLTDKKIDQIFQLSKEINDLQKQINKARGENTNIDVDKLKLKWKNKVNELQVLDKYDVPKPIY